MGRSDYFGHEENVRALKEALPVVSLFLGPESVGKWELAEWIRLYHKVRSADTLRIKRLTQPNAKFVAEFASREPHGEYSLCIIRLEKTTSTALNTLLKTLEESTRTKFILISTYRPLPTIVSRSAVFEFGVLREENVVDILTNVRNFSPETATARAKKAHGQVKNALHQESSQDDKVLVIRALEAVASKDIRTLEALASKWQTEHTDLLVTWCYEQMTTRWNVFREDETSLKGKALPLKLLMALKEDLRPRLVVRAALASLIQS